MSIRDITTEESRLLETLMERPAFIPEPARERLLRDGFVDAVYDDGRCEITPAGRAFVLAVRFSTATAALMIAARPG